MVTGDFNGDSLCDIAYYSSRGEDAGRLYVSFNTGPDNFEAPIHFELNEDIDFIPGKTEFLSADIDGNGFSDLLVYQNADTASYRWQVCLNDGKGSFGDCVPFNANDDNSIYREPVVPFAGDLTGDGLDDIGVYVKSGMMAGTWFLLPNAGNIEFGPFLVLAAEKQKFGKREKHLPLVIDCNGDGWDEPMIYWQEGPRAGSWEIAVNMKEKGFGPWVQALYAFQGPYLPFIGDFDGDGFDDILVKHGSEDEAGEWVLELNRNCRNFETVFPVKFGSNRFLLTD
jgi:hypothetical protein